MRRRQFIRLLGGAAAVWPLAARAQQSAMPVVGFLNSETPDLFAYLVRAFRQGLGQSGFVDGDNVAIEFRWAHGQYDRLPALVADLIRRQVSVIAANSPAPVMAAKAATTTIPIVFATGYDPVAAGLVASLARPGGNLTGVTSLTAEVGPKRVELLRELVPTATSIALLVNPAAGALRETISTDLQAAARKLGLQFHVLHASAADELDTVFATLARLSAGGLVIGSDPFFNSQSKQLAAGRPHRRPQGNDYVDFARDQICRKLRQPIQDAVGPTVGDRKVFPLNVSEPVERIMELTYANILSRSVIEDANTRYLRRLLRARRERPPRGRADERYELAPFHSITSSARSRIDVGTSKPRNFAVLRLMISSTFVVC